MQVLDTSVTNVALPHMQGSLSAGVEEVSWVITSYLAANAVIIPATGWLSALLGPQALLPDLPRAVHGVARSCRASRPTSRSWSSCASSRGSAAGPIIPISQAILWEIFPLSQRGLAMAVWGVGIMMGPIIGPTVGGWIADNWSWRWIFYINLPIGAARLPAGQRVPVRLRRISGSRAAWTWPGLVLMVLGFGCLQLMLDRGEREDWFDSRLIVALAVMAVCALVGFLVRELTAKDPILDFAVFTDRNFALGATFIALIGLGIFYSSMLLLALYTQKLLGYDAWTSGARAGAGRRRQPDLAADRRPAGDPRGPALLLALGLRAATRSAST